MDIKIPGIYEDIISRNTTVKSALIFNINSISEMLQRNSLFYFPEYTDHGREHLQSVLDTSIDIVSDKAFKILTPEDVYVLVSSILLHDIAMHFEYQQVVSMMVGETYSGSLFKFTSERSWSDLWVDHEKRISALSEVDKIKLFGSNLKILFPSIENEYSHNKIDRLIIGDFIRIHHARIAQMIAEIGWPSTIPIALGTFGDEHLSADIKNLNYLAGVCARSHHLSFRDSADLFRDYRGNKSDGRRLWNCHITFVMGILRLSDLFQFDKKRTPRILFRLNTFISPVSLSEWKKHLSILNVDKNKSDDPECIAIECSPEDPHIVDALRTLFNYVQFELDQFWAVVGEYYSGAHKGEFTNIGIKYRRLESNIDSNTSHCLATLPYLADLGRIRFDSVSMAKLLVKPLYGSNPFIGLRELIQNAVDACKENLVVSGGSPKDYNVQVVVDNINSVVIVSDNALGMTEDVIRNHFLTIGSSFRWSSSWAENYTSKNKVLVCRSGRFGVGILAAFLIGDKIRVRTKSPQSDVGYSFSFEILDESIAIKKEYNLSSGTEITIYNSNIKRFENEDFCYKLKYPRVNYKCIDRHGLEHELKAKMESIFYEKTLDNRLVYGQLEIDFKILPSSECGIIIYNGFCVKHLDIYKELSCMPDFMSDFRMALSLVISDPENIISIDVTREMLFLRGTEIEPLLTETIRRCFVKHLTSSLPNKELDFIDSFSSIKPYIRCNSSDICILFPFYLYKNEWVFSRCLVHQNVKWVLIYFYGPSAKELYRAMLSSNTLAYFQYCQTDLSNGNISGKKIPYKILSSTLDITHIYFFGDSYKLCSADDVLSESDMVVKNVSGGCLVSRSNNLLNEILKLSEDILNALSVELKSTSIIGFNKLGLDEDWRRVTPSIEDIFGQSVFPLR